MRRALIGGTGFIGRNLLEQAEFDGRYSSANITAVRDEHYDLVVCAAPSAVKWIANKDPIADRAHIQRLIDGLEGVRTKRFVHISTADVHWPPADVDEESPVDPLKAQPYGRHRYELEEFVRGHFPDATVLRLPNLFGNGLKKNFLYDLMHGRPLDLTHSASQFQFYDVRRLWSDITRALAADVRCLHMAVEPATAQEIAKACFDVHFEHQTAEPPATYRLRSRYLERLGYRNPYLFSKDEVFQQIRDFVRSGSVPA